MVSKTIFDKIWESHIVAEEDGKPDLLYIDLHLVHEVTSPQAFEGLKLKGRRVRRPDLTFATMDHNVPTKDRFVLLDAVAKKQMDTLRDNCREYNIPLADHGSAEQGIVHIIGPELGLTQPGKTIVCGDSHTSTHGAFGTLAFGIGTSEVEHVLATQSLWQQKPKNLQIKVNGRLGIGVTAKDVILAVIAKYGVNAGVGSVIEFTGEAVRNMTMEQRMTLCNMSIEAGAKAGLVSPDEVTFNYLKGRKHVAAGEEFDKQVYQWRTFATDDGAEFDKTIEIEGEAIEPQVTWGTNPSMCVPIHACVPDPESYSDKAEQRSISNALQYMGLNSGTAMTDVDIQHVFIGSCTNARLSDLRSAAEVVKGSRVAPSVSAIVVPGSQQVKQQAEEEKLDKIFLDAGFEWRDSGCSMCLSMNNDVVPEGERCASTSNRNFEGRQGKGARTHLVSPAMAAAAAVTGKFTDVRTFQNKMAGARHRLENPKM